MEGNGQEVVLSPTLGGVVSSGIETELIFDGSLRPQSDIHAWKRPLHPA